MNAKILSGVPWFDQHGHTVNAHGACLVYENGKYYLFGEYKTDDVNKYIGFSCYSTDDFTHWHFEGLALGPQESGLLGPERIGERVKVLRCPATGRYVMLMHTDDMKYCDPHIGLAVSERIQGPYTFVGPLLYRDEPIHRWDMGTFVDDDGTAYLLTHEGDIYRLSEDYTQAVELVAKDFAPGGESPACLKRDGVYYMMFSNKTSWERNDNYYFTATDLHGPWTHRGLFCPAGSLTYNSQCSFVLEYDGPQGRVPVYVGDRWSFPRQASAATLVLQPLTVKAGKLSIPAYWPCWSPDTMEPTTITPAHTMQFRAKAQGKICRIPFTGHQVMLFGKTDCNGGYAEVSIVNAQGETLHHTSVDFYSLVPDEGLKYVSPELPEGRYELRVSPAGCGGEWFKKDGTHFGSMDTYIEVTGWTAI